VIDPFLESIGRTLHKEMTSKILKEDKAYWFVAKNYVISFISVVCFWATIFRFLPDFYTYDLALIETLFFISVIGVANCILLFYRKPRLQATVFVLSFVSSFYLYSPFLKSVSSVLSSLLIYNQSPLYLLASVTIWPLILGKRYLSILGKTKTTSFQGIVDSIKSGLMLEISFFPTVFFQSIGMLFLPVLQRCLETRMYEGTYPRHILEHSLKREAFQENLEDTKFEGYHYYIFSLKPIYFVRAFGDKTLVLKIKGTKLPFEEQLSILQMARKEYSIQSKICLTGIHGDKIDTTYEHLYEIKNIAKDRRLTSDGINFYLPSDYRNVVFTDYFGEIKPIKNDGFLREVDYCIRFREPLKKNQLALVALRYETEFKRPEGILEKGKKERLFISLQNAIVSKIKLWMIEIVSKCAIEFLTAKPSCKELDKNSMKFEFRNIKPKKTIRLEIEFRV